MPTVFASASKLPVQIAGQRDGALEHTIRRCPPLGGSWTEGVWVFGAHSSAQPTVTYGNPASPTVTNSLL
jgi:hypothetical protein